MQLLNEDGVTKEQILKVLAAVPMPAETVSALKAAHACGATIIVVSDANTVFINEILKAQGLDGVIHRVITNPATWSDDGTLVVRRLHQPSDPHGCERCAKTPNMCKGKIVTELIAEHTPSVVIYGGDGGNDFCAACSLRPSDYILPRAGYTLETKLAEDKKEGTALVSATPRLWSNYVEFEEAITELAMQHKL